MSTRSTFNIDPAKIEAGDHRQDARHYGGPSFRACRFDGRDHCDCQAARPGGDRRRGLRHRYYLARQAGRRDRRYRMLFLSSAQGHYHGRRQGMVTTNRDDLATKVASYRNHGSTGQPPADTEPHGPWTMARFERLGFNLRMSDIQAAVGVAQMAKLNRLLAERRKCAERYSSLLAGVEEVARPAMARDSEGHSYQSYVVRVLKGGRGAAQRGHGSPRGCGYPDAARDARGAPARLLPRQVPAEGGRFSRRRDVRRHDHHAADFPRHD